MFHHHRRYPLLHSRIGLLILLVLVIIILVFVFGSGSDDDMIALNGSPSLQNQLSTLEQNKQHQQTTPTTTPTQTQAEYCEDYVFEEGEQRELFDHQVLVSRLSSKGAKIVVDGDEELLLLGDSERFADGFLVELEKLFYFQADDPDNMITLRLGCEDDDENPNDKYVREKGENICEDLYLTCKSSFNLE